MTTCTTTSSISTTAPLEAALFAALPGGFLCLSGPDSTIVATNAACAGWLTSKPGADPDELIGQTLTDVCRHGGPLAGLHLGVQKAQSELTLEEHLVGVVWLKVVARPAQLGGGDMVTLMVATDVTALVARRLALEGQARHDPSFLASVLDALESSVTVFSYPDLRVELVNNKLCEYFSGLEGSRVSKGKLLGHLLADSRFGGAAHDPAALATKAGVTRATVRLDLSSYAKSDGSCQYGKVMYTPLERDGVVTHIVSSSIDVTDAVLAEKRVNEKLLAQYDLLGRALDGIDVAMTVLDGADLRHLYVNRFYAELASRLSGRDVGAAEIVGITAEEALGQAVPGYAAALGQAAASGEERAFEAVPLPTGEVQRLFRVVYTPLADPGTGATVLVGLALDVTDFVRSKEQLESLSRAKDELLATCAHELRTPLSVMHNTIQILKVTDTEGNEDHRLAAFDAAMGQCRRMNRLIADLVDYSKLGSGQLTMNMGPVRLHTSVEAAVEDFRMGCSTHHWVLESVVACEVYADSVRLDQVLMNLMGNASRYSDASTTVTIGMRLVCDRVRVSVSDEGWGIPPEAIPRLFERYYRQEGTAAAVPQGMGIGLYVSRETVRAHGGTLGVESEVGKGSTFWFELPLFR